MVICSRTVRDVARYLHLLAFFMNASFPSLPFLDCYQGNLCIGTQDSFSMFILIALAYYILVVKSKNWTEVEVRPVCC